MVKSIMPQIKLIKLCQRIVHSLTLCLKYKVVEIQSQYSSNLMQKNKNNIENIF